LAVEGSDPQVRDAVLAAQKQAVADPASGTASGHLGMVLQAHALYEPAAQCYRRAIRLEPNEFAWKYYLALTLQQLFQPQQALNALAPALRIRSGYAPAVLKKGELLFQLGRFQESGAAYESLLAQDATSAEALYGAARVKYAQGDVSGAEDFYSRACQAYPKFGGAYYGLALAGRSRGHTTESARNFELAQIYAVDRPPAEDPVLGQVEELATGVFNHLDQADRLANKGQTEEAAKLTGEMLERDPENLTLMLNLLYLARFTARFDDKVDAVYAKAKRINPELPYIYDYYGAVLARQGKYDAAASALRNAIARKPDAPEPHKLLGGVLEHENRAPEAIEEYQRSLAAEPSDRTIQVKLWFLLVLHGRSREAIPQLAAALPIEDSFTSTRLLLLGEAYRSTGDAGKARQYLEQARSRASNEGSSDKVAMIDQELKQLPSRP
jgi:tetratricopeptide (TPR) repeat protein